jgi:4-aminobutyrate aminotransferase
MLRRICDRYGILLVADEVQSGIGRTGKMFACEHFGLVPDVVCLAKGIASGLPLGAVVARAELMDWPSGSHASTFGGNPVCCRAALVTLDLLEREYLQNAARRGDQLLAGLRQLAQLDPGLANPRGLGLMVAIDAMSNQRPDPQRREGIIEAAFHRGLLLLGCGKAGVRFCPPLCVTADQVDSALAIFAEACADVAAN